MLRRVDGVQAGTNGVLHRICTTTPSPHASTPSLHAVAATKDAAARLGERLVEAHDDRAHAFDGHVQLMLFMF